MKRYNKYITRKRAKFSAITGPVNIPFGTELYTMSAQELEINGRPIVATDGIFICHEEHVLSATTSQNAAEFFTQNDDGQGFMRAKILPIILGALGRKMLKVDKPDPNYQKRWDIVMDDPVAQKYRDPNHADFWLWDITFYNADIEDLKHIADLLHLKYDLSESEGGK